jgi:hypothetical protein
MTLSTRTDALTLDAAALTAAANDFRSYATDTSEDADGAVRDGEIHAGGVCVSLQGDSL